MVIWIALAAALAYAVGTVLQHMEAVGQPSAGGSLLARLARRPMWLLGLLCNALGWGLQALALARGQLMVVQPLLICAILFALPMTAAAHRQPISGREWGGSTLVSVGLALFLVNLQPQGTTQVAPWMTWLQVGAAAATVAWLSVVAAQGHATGLGVAAGVLFGLAAALTKAFAMSAAHGLWLALFGWPLYAMAAVTASAFYLTQRAFQAGALAASFPALIALDPVVAAVLGIWLYGERVQAEPLQLWAGLAGVCLVVWGLVVLSRTPLVRASYA